MIVDGVGVFRVDVYLQLMRRLPWNRGSVLGTDPLSVRSLTRREALYSPKLADLLHPPP